MIIHSPIISGSLTFAEGGTFTLPDNGVYSGSFSGSFQGDGSNLTFGGTGIISGASQLQAEFLDTLGDGVVSGSSQITITDTTGFSTFSSSLKSTDDEQVTRISNLESFSSSLDSGFVTEGELSSLSSSVDSTINSLTTDNITEGTNLYYTDARVKTKLDSETVVSGSSQVSYLDLSNIPGGIVSGSSQVDATSITNFDSEVKSQLNAENVISSSVQIDLGNVSNNTTTNVSEGTNLYYTDARVKTKLDAETVISGSSQVSYVNLSNIPGGIVSGSSQVSYVNLSNIPGGIVSGSSQVDAASVTNFDSEVKLKLDTDGVVSGSSQVSYVGLSNIPGSIVSGSSQVSYIGLSNIPGGIVSGSSQVSYVDLSAIPSGIVSGSSQVSYVDLSNIPGGIVSGSSQIDLGSVSNNTTTNVSEGTNLYYTDARVKTKLNSEGVISGSSQVSLSTTNVSEGTNLYYTDARVKTKLNTETVVSGSGQILTLVSIDEDAMTSNSDTKLPTQQSVKAYVDTKVANLVDSAPGALDTLNELAAALGDDSNFSTTISNQIAGKVSQSLEIISGDGLTGGGNLTTNRTLAVGQGSGISVTADAVAVDGTVLRTTGFGVISGSAQVNHDSTTGFVANEHIDHSSVSVVAGSGLTGGGTIAENRTINVGAGDGISVAADAVAVDGTVLRTTGFGVVSGSAQVTLGGDLSGTANSATVTKVQGIALTSGEATQLANIDTTTISATQWGYLGALNQGLTTTSTVQFGKVGVGGASDATYELKVTGDIGATGDIVAYISSDERLKDNVELIQDPIGKVKELKGVTWEWNENASEAAKQSPNVGVIAQDVEKVLPQLVNDRENGYKGVDYSKLTGLLIEVVKEQQERIEKLEERLTNLEGK